MKSEGEDEDDPKSSKLLVETSFRRPGDYIGTVILVMLGICAIVFLLLLLEHCFPKK